MNRKKRICVIGRGIYSLLLGRWLGNVPAELILITTSANDLASYSSIWSRVILAPKPDLSQEHYLAFIRTIKQVQPDYLIPSVEDIFYLAQEESWEVPLLAPPLSTLITLHHKGKFSQLCQELEIPCPRTYFPPVKDHQLPSKIVIKEVFSRGSLGTRITSREDFVHHQKPTVDYIIQEFIEGELCSCFGLAIQGRLVYFVAYRHVCTNNGFPSVKEMIELPQGRSEVVKIVNRLNYHGPIAFDLIVTFSQSVDSIYFIECNPRFSPGLAFLQPIRSYQAVLAGDEVLVDGPDQKLQLVLMNLFKGHGFYFLRDEIWSWWDPWPFFWVIWSVILKFFHWLFSSRSLTFKDYLKQLIINDLVTYPPLID